MDGQISVGGKCVNTDDGNNDGDGSGSGGGGSGSSSGSGTNPDLCQIYGECLMGPPEPNACYQNVPCLINPQLTMHFTDITRGGRLIARVIIRAADGTIIGYREVIYVPNDSGWTWNGHAPGELNSIVMATSGLAVGVTEYLLELVPVTGFGLGVLAIIDALNQNIENSGHFVVSPIIPQHDLDNQINFIVPALPPALPHR